MACRLIVAIAFLAIAFSNSISAQPLAEKSATPKSAEQIDGPPVVSAKAWIVVDATSGKQIGGDHEAEPRPMASTSKIMTAWIVLRLAADDAKVLDEIVTYSEEAAKTPGSSAKLKTGEKLAVRELLYGLMLPSGNDAAVALAEHFGTRVGKAGKDSATAQFVAEMNRQAKALGLKEMSYKDPNGLSRDNVSSVRDLATLAREAMKDERFRGYVRTRSYECEVTDGTGGKRKVAWTNTNKLLDVEGYEGIKTGTTTPAGNCLVGCARRGEDRLIVVVLGSTATDGRYVDARNLFRWGWREHALAKQEAQPPSKNRKNVAVFVHNGVELLDFAGPAETFAAADRGRAFNVYTVAASADDVISQGFLRIKPKYTLANCPKPDLIVLPGGATRIPLGDERVIKWIQQSTPDSEIVMSVCTGAFLLAKAGLLDDKEATTHWGSIEALKKSAPKTKVHSDRRYVDNGKVVTCAGVSAGIDGALHVVDRLLGKQAAQDTARYMEYRWEPSTRKD
jgi:D-alanyl-D-alanine carboxypeptidase (penicillin-binding protein 5/6)